MNPNTPPPPTHEVVEREADYRRKLLDQFLGGKVHFEDHRGEFEAMRHWWMAPQCAVLQWLLDWLRDRRALAPRDLEPFLEIGAFTSHLSGYLASAHGLAGVASDLDESIVRRAIDDLLPAIDMQPEILTAARADAAALPFEDNRFGLVFCFSALHHFAEPERCLAEFHRVLRPGGVFLCAWEPIQPRWRKSRRPTDGSEVEAGLIENVFTIDEYDRMVRSAFDDVVSMPYDEPRLPASLSFAKPLLNAAPLRPARRALIDRLGGQDYSVAAFKQE